jgi:hypothetical protein
MKKYIFTNLGMFILFTCPAFSQVTETNDEAAKPKASFKVTTDVVSTYIWRGTVGSSNPNIQPTLAVVYGGLEAGVWGSTDFLASYKEFDTYISYTAGWLKVTVTDYDWTFNTSTYLNYKRDETNHILEGSLTFLGTESFPVSIAINTMFYGADKKWDKESESFSRKQNYSTYIELGYAFGSSSVFLGMTPSNGYYGAGYGNIDGFSVCNIGLTSVRNIKITPDFALPLKGTVYLNPQAESVHFVIGMTF